MSKPKAKAKVKEITFTVVGLHYRLTSHQIESLETECPLMAELVRDPENEYDENAVAVYLREKPFKDTQIGYLSRQVAQEIAPRMDAGKFEPIEVWLSDVHPSDGSVGGQGSIGELYVKL